MPHDLKWIIKSIEELIVCKTLKTVVSGIESLALPGMFLYLALSIASWIVPLAGRSQGLAFFNETASGPGLNDMQIDSLIAEGLNARQANRSNDVEIICFQTDPQIPPPPARARSHDCMSIIYDIKESDKSTAILTWGNSNEAAISVPHEWAPVRTCRMQVDLVDRKAKDVEDRFSAMDVAELGQAIVRACIKRVKKPQIARGGSAPAGPKQQMRVTLYGQDFTSGIVDLLQEA